MAGYLSTDTTDFTSDVSIARNLVVAGTQTVTGAQTFTGVATFSDAINSASAASFGAVTGTTGNFTSALSGHTTLAVGGTKAITYASVSSTSIVATTVTATMSVTTTYTDNAVAAGDFIQVSPSALSNGVVLQAVASGASEITFIYSNVSAANAAQTKINARYIAWRF